MDRLILERAVFRIPARLRIFARLGMSVPTWAAVWPLALGSMCFHPTVPDIN